ncbi:cytochrome P450 736A117-like [Amaranthus tricolor]|uniref:cytochrome P450 736A117-like n=1 Tax=Amaranthus tricolor TaxID=29722 RepID=UPI00258FEBB5|nr:cytochrome P450 736A117-like [Amaranthus tricolor]
MMENTIFCLFQDFLQKHLFFYPFTIPFILFVLLLYKSTITISSNGKNTPKSPPKLPIIGNLHQLGKLPHRSLHSLSQRYGKLMLLHLGSKPTLIVSSSKFAQEILKTNDIMFSNRINSYISSKFFYGGKDMSFSPYGDYWKQIRSTCVTQLLSNKKVQSLRSIREEEVGLMVKKIKNSCNLVVNLRELIMIFTNDVICLACFGKKYSHENNEGGKNFYKLLNDAMKLLGNFSLRDVSPWLGWIDKLKGLDDEIKRVAHGLDEILDKVIEETQNKMSSRENIHGGDDKEMNFVEILLEFHKKNKDVFQLDGIKAVIMDMFVGGTDTTYTLIEWTMIELIRHPKVMKQLQQEVRETVGGNGNKVICEDDLEKLTYLKAVVKESLRLHPPFPLIFRWTSQNVKVNGLDVVAGTQVIVNSWAIQRDPSIWEEPKEFRPERFLNNNTYDSKGQNFHNIPFGGGRRICPAISFGVIKAELVIATLIYEFDWELPSGSSIDMTEINGLAVQTRDPPMLIATPFVSG